MATDDRGLDRVTIFWGEVGFALEVLPVAGDSAAWRRSHLYRQPGFYTIRVQATDTSEQVVTRVWGVTVDPNGGAIAATTRTFGVEDGDEGYNLVIDGEVIHALRQRDSTVVAHVPVGPRDVFLADVAPNCEVPSNPRKVSVVLGDTAVVAFDVTCR